jgi:hypothetical protein
MGDSWTRKPSPPLIEARIPLEPKGEVVLDRSGYMELRIHLIGCRNRKADCARYSECAIRTDRLPAYLTDPVYDIVDGWRDLQPALCVRLEGRRLRWRHRGHIAGTCSARAFVLAFAMVARTPKPSVLP